MTLARVARRLWYLAATVILLAALLVSATRLLTPYLNKHLPDVESWASLLLKTPVEMGKVYISWDVYQPQLIFDQVRFLDKKNHKPKIQIDQIKVDINILSTVMVHELIVSKIKFSGVHLSVHQVANGLWTVEGINGLEITDKLTGSAVETNELLGWIFSIRSLVLKDVEIDFHPKKGQTLFFILNKLVLHNADASHSLIGEGALNQDIPTKISLNLAWQGKVSDLAHLSAHAYVYLEGLSLPQWLDQQSFKNLQIKQGLGSLKIWADWKDNAWQKIQSRLQFYALTVKSTVTQKMLVIPRLSAHIGWRQDKEKQIIAGDQIFLDLPNHLWPVTSFVITLLPDKNGQLFPEMIETSYVDLSDVKDILASIGLLADPLGKQIQSIDPQGEIKNLQLKNTDAVMDLMHTSISMAFDSLSYHGWQKIPGMTNASGMFIWDGQKGTLTLNSLNTAVLANQMLNSSVYFDQMSGIIEFQQVNNNWVVAAKNLLLQNNDAKLFSNFNMTLPATGLPEVNLTANFEIKDMSHLIMYMPLKIMEADLVTWLRNAFMGGQLNSGKLTLQGNLADFPFDNGKGIIRIEGIADKMDFRFAPGWPALMQLDGKIGFAGHNMTIDVVSGNILDVPISSIHADINHFIDKEPQVLTLQSQMKSDLSKGLQFIHQSPLQKSIGKNIENMTLTGPMDLTLSMTVPLKNPSQAKIQGNIITTDADMQLPAWKLSLEKLQGSFQFTESDLLAKDVHGQFYGEDLLLNITTQHPKNASSYIQATLQSQVSVPTVQKWLNIPISSLVDGKTAFTANIDLYSQAQATRSTQMDLQTDLKGITLNLPVPYGKKSDEVRNLQVGITAEDKKILAKINYNKLVTAALTYETSQGAMHFIGGEVSLGGDAKWQKLPGILLSGDFKQLDWEKLQNQFSGKSTIDTSSLRGINLNVSTFLIYGQQLDHARIQLNKHNDGWLVDINSEQIAGQLTVPTQHPKEMIEGRFQRLYLKTNQVKRAFNIDINKIPPLTLTAESVRINDMNLGSVGLHIQPIQGAINIDELRIQSSLVNMHASGEWHTKIHGNESHLSGSISTDHLSELLDAWGVGINSLICNKGNANFELTWSDVPFNPAIAGMSGKVSLSLGQGKVIHLSEENNAKMDLGRLLNLFSLSSLPRELSSNSVSASSQKGYDFDYIKGDFSLHDGNASTNNTRIDGPLAGIQISGRIGLAAKDVDIKLDVTPYVTSTIPTVVAIASLNPVAVIATWAADKMLGGTVSKVATHHYVVRGPWSNPVWSQSN